MKILAVDTALAACSAAVYDGEMQRVLAAAFQPMATGQAEAIGPMVRGVMENSGMTFSSLVQAFVEACHTRPAVASLRSLPDDASTASVRR